VSPTRLAECSGDGHESTAEAPFPELPLMGDKVDVVTAVIPQTLGPLAMRTREVRFDQVDAHRQEIPHRDIRPWPNPPRPFRIGRITPLGNEMGIGRFPPRGFLTLGVLSLAATAVFIVRAISIDATGERIISAIVFGAMGVLWLVAYRSIGGPK